MENTPHATNAPAAAPSLPPPLPPPKPMLYYVRKDGVQTGPYTGAALKAQVAAGMLPDDVSVWCKGMTEWREYGKVFADPSSTDKTQTTLTDRQPKEKSDACVQSVTHNAEIVQPLSKQIGEQAQSEVRKEEENVPNSDLKESNKKVQSHELPESAKGMDGKHIRKHKSIFAAGIAIVVIAVVGWIVINKLEQYSIESEYQKGVAHYEAKDAPEKAVEHFYYAAERGHAGAQCYLGLCCSRGEGVDKDSTESFVWFMKSAEQGYAQGQLNVGLSYLYGKGVHKDDESALKWFKLAAEQGNAVAQYNAGACYFEGIGTDKDGESAFKWFKLAAEQGHVVAQYSVGFCYANGVGTAEDFKSSFMWYKKAAEQGDADSQFKLGLLCLMDEEGLPYDMREAVKWLEKAAAQGHKQAKQTLEKL